MRDHCICNCCTLLPGYSPRVPSQIRRLARAQARLTSGSVSGSSSGASTAHTVRYLCLCLMCLFRRGRQRRRVLGRERMRTAASLTRRPHRLHRTRCMCKHRRHASSAAAEASMTSHDFTPAPPAPRGPEAVSILCYFQRSHDMRRHRRQPPHSAATARQQQHSLACTRWPEHARSCHWPPR